MKEMCPTILSDSHGTPHAVAYGLISKGNGEVILSEEKHMSLTTGGGQAGQGYPCVLVTGVDLYNQETTGGGGDDIDSQTK